MELSKRLLMVASMVEPGSIVADVGCDHGYVSIYLVRQGICPRVLAMDVNAGPLERVKAHVQEAGLAAYIDIRRSDGLSACGREAGGGHASYGRAWRACGSAHPKGWKADAFPNAMHDPSAPVGTVAGAGSGQADRIFHLR